MSSNGRWFASLTCILALGCGPEDATTPRAALELPAEEAPPAVEEAEPELNDLGEVLLRFADDGSDAPAAIEDEPLLQVTGPDSLGYGPPDDCEAPATEEPPALDLDLEDDGGAGDLDTTTAFLSAAGPGKRPHWGSRTHGDNSCSRPSKPWWSNTYNNFSVYTWGGCHRTVYYRIRSSVRARGTAWVRAVERAFAAWDRGTLCSPHFVNIERAPAGAVARVEVEYRGGAGHCSSSNTWYACVVRDRARSRNDQHWWMNLNSAQPYGIGVSGRLDVQSLVTVELAHVLYFGHFPSYADSISTANTGRWGSTHASMGSADSCNFQPYLASCANCGNRRSPKPGDLALLQHLYAAHPGGCSTVGQRQCRCGGKAHSVRTCLSNHTWSGCSTSSSCP